MDGWRPVGSVATSYKAAGTVRPAVNHPVGPHPFSMTWTDGLFVHWPFDPASLRPHVPAHLELDTYDGRAWASVLPFVLARAGFRFSPAWTRLTFPELNCRTYVRFDGTPGLYFFSIDVDQPLVSRIVRGTTRLPCYPADMAVRPQESGVRFRSVRERGADPEARFDATYGPDGEPFRAVRGTLDHWLAERRRLYDPVGRRVLYADIAHEPWPLQSAEVTIRENTMFEANGLPTPKGDPRFRYCGRLEMTGSVPRWIRSLDATGDLQPQGLVR